MGDLRNFMGFKTSSSWIFGIRFHEYFTTQKYLSINVINFVISFIYFFFYLFLSLSICCNSRAEVYWYFSISLVSLISLYELNTSTLKWSCYVMLCYSMFVAMLVYIKNVFFISFRLQPNHQRQPVHQVHYWMLFFFSRIFFLGWRSID